MWAIPAPRCRAIGAVSRCGVVFRPLSPVLRPRSPAPRYLSRARDGRSRFLVSPFCTASTPARPWGRVTSPLAVSCLPPPQAARAIVVRRFPWRWPFQGAREGVPAASGGHRARVGAPRCVPPRPAPFVILAGARAGGRQRRSSALVRSGLLPLVRDAVRPRRVGGALVLSRKTRCSDESPRFHARAAPRPAASPFAPNAHGPNTLVLVFWPSGRLALAEGAALRPVASRPFRDLSCAREGGRSTLRPVVLLWRRAFDLAPPKLRRQVPGANDLRPLEQLRRRFVPEPERLGRWAR